jgi:uncharacterized membrane protein
VPPAPVEVPIAAKVGLEERLASRWLVWLGAVALALAGLFLILYAVEHGWIGPTARVALGLLLGIALAAAGEWTRRRPWQRFAGQHTDHAPGALAGAGLFVAFASIYGAHALYGLIGPLTTFIGLALVAAAGFALAALHAPIVAVVGLLAAFATPMLVASDTPSAAGLFGYLALVVAAALGRGALSRLGVAGRQRGHGRLPVDDPVAVRCLPAGRPVRGDGLSRFPRRDERLAGERGDAAGRAGAVAVAPARAEPASVRVRRVPGRRIAGRLGDRRDRRHRRRRRHVAPVLVLVAATVAAYVYGRRNERFDGLTVVAGVLLVVSLAGWPLGDMLRRAVEVYTGPGASAGGLIAEPARPFLFIATGLAALVAGLGYRLLWGASGRSCGRACRR